MSVATEDDSGLSERTCSGKKSLKHTVHILPGLVSYIPYLPNSIAPTVAIRLLSSNPWPLIPRHQMDNHKVIRLAFEPPSRAEDERGN